MNKYFVSALLVVFVFINYTYGQVVILDADYQSIDSIEVYSSTGFFPLSNGDSIAYHYTNSDTIVFKVDSPYSRIERCNVAVTRGNRVIRVFSFDESLKISNTTDFYFSKLSADDYANIDTINYELKGTMFSTIEVYPIDVIIEMDSLVFSFKLENRELVYTKKFFFKNASVAAPSRLPKNE